MRYALVIPVSLAQDKDATRRYIGKAILATDIPVGEFTRQADLMAEVIHDAGINAGLNRPLLAPGPEPLFLTTGAFAPWFMAGESKPFVMAALGESERVLVAYERRAVNRQQVPSERPQDAARFILGSWSSEMKFVFSAHDNNLLGRANDPVILASARDWVIEGVCPEMSALRAERDMGLAIEVAGARRPAPCGGL